MDVGELLSYQVGGAAELGRRTLIRTWVAGRRTSVPSFISPFLAPSPGPGAPHFSCHRGPSLSFHLAPSRDPPVLFPFIPFQGSSPFSTRLGSSSPYAWARSPSTLLHNHPLPLSSSPGVGFVVVGERWSLHLSPSFSPDWRRGFWTSYFILFEPQVLYV